MFEKTRIKLTAWYLLIIMIISLLFSVVIYSIVNSEFIRFERMQIRIQQEMENGIPPHAPRFVQIDPGTISEAREHLITRLALINLAIFIFSGAAGYFLAGRTLRPIKNSMEEQKRFISDSSHELRTPLTSLRSEIEVGLLDKNLTLIKSKKILESNLEEVISLQTLSDNLLELAQNGKTINKDADTLSLENIIQNAIKKLEPTAKAKEIKIENTVKKAKVKGIEDRLQELFVILIDNAIKYSPKKSTVEIKSKQSGNKVEILVIDHGRGISEKDLPHIFDRFYRSDESRSESGYGLGLSIGKKIVESHNGEIEATSEIGKETIFKVILPAQY